MIADLTIWNVASIPMWGLAILFFASIFVPRDEFEARDNTVHVAVCLLASTLAASFAAAIWDASLRLGMFVSLPFWICAGLCAIGTYGAVRNQRPGETRSDLAVQGVLGLIGTGIMAVLAALVWRYV